MGCRIQLFLRLKTTERHTSLMHASTCRFLTEVQVLKQIQDNFRQKHSGELDVKSGTCLKRLQAGLLQAQV